MVSIALLLVGCKEPLDASLYPDQVVELSVHEPAAAAMVRAGPTTVRGEVKGLTALAVNGWPAKVDGNLWEAELELPRGITTVEVGGLDATGHRVFVRQSVLAGEFAPQGATVDQGLGVRLNQGGIDATGALVAGLVDPAAIDALLPSINPVFEYSAGAFGIEAVEVTADLESLWFSPPALTLDPGAGALAVEVVLPDLYVVVPAYGQALSIDFDVDLTLTADAVVTGFVELGTDNGALTANLVAPTVELQDFYFDTSLLPGGVEDWLLSDTIRGVVEDLLVEQVSTMVPDLLDEQLAGLQIAFETELLGKAMELGASFDTVAIDRDGVLMLADVDVAVQGPFPKSTEGWLLAGGSTLRPATGPDLAIELSDDVVNRLLHDLWRSGMLDLSLSTTDGSIDPLMLAPLGAKAEGTIAVDADLPPVLIQRGGQAVLQLGEMGVTIDTPGGDNGDHLVVTIAGEVPIDLALADSMLTMGLGTPEITLMVRENDWGASNETITNLLTQELPVATLLALLGDIEIPLPAIGDLAIPDATIGRADGGLSTTIDMEL